jgi:ATP-binding cassette subfamily B protein
VVGEESGSRAAAGILRRALGLLRPHRRHVSLLGAVILLVSALGVAAPLLTKAVFDDALFPASGEPRLGLLTWLVGLMIALILLAGLLSLVQAYLASVIGQRVIHDLRETLYSHLQRMSLRFFTTRRTGEIQARLAQDVGGVGAVMSGSAASILANCVFVLTSLVAMTLLSWELTALSLVVLPAFVYLTYRVGKIRRRLASSTQETIAELSVIAEETLSVSGALLTKVFDRHRDAVERYRTESRRLADLRVRQQMVGRATLGLAQTFFLIAPAVVYLVAGYALAGGATGLTAGTLVAFTALQIRLFTPVRDLMETSIEVQASLALFERIFEYLDLPHEIADAPDARRLEKSDAAGAICFRHVFFRYDGTVEATNGSPPWTLEDVSLEVEPGGLAAIVGPSGAGKTTICYLLARLYDAARGAVEIDGVDVRRIKLSSLAELIGMVTQETYLFHASVRDNLLYARPGAGQEEIEAAARAAFIHQRILELPDGYDTLVGERGYRMSGGEKQRLAIARALLKDPRILVLDEATSSLDTASERLVQAALRPLTAGRTTLAIAHRLSTILSADVIFVVERGCVVERGTHQELLGRGGLYADLYRQQFQGGLVEARCEDGIVLVSGDVLTTSAAAG